MNGVIVYTVVKVPRNNISHWKMKIYFLSKVQWLFIVSKMVG